MSNPTGESSSASTKKPVYNPDVFLSFAGKDTRHGFTSFLYRGLRSRGINTFRDDKTTRKGKFFGKEVIHAIQESKIFFVVFSKGFRYSKWCLNELELIHKCVVAREPHKVFPLVYPIFYKIEARDIRDRNKFEIVMEEVNEKRKEINKLEFIPEQKEKWGDALSFVGNAQGYNLKEGSDEAELIEGIVIDVFNLIPKLLHVREHIVGLESRVEKAKSLLDIGSKSSDDIVLMLLIHGTGGIGKTTFAKVLFNEIVYQFEGASFLSNVKGKSIESLQELLLKDAMGQDYRFGNEAMGASEIKKALCKKKILLVLDDVDHRNQLDMLAGRYDWFRAGSRIIITSRENELVDKTEVNNRSYEMKVLNDSEALECLSWYAFRDSKPVKGFEKVAKRAIRYAQGLPIALKVIGSDLKGENLEQWDEALRYYEETHQPGEIRCVLQRSYEKLTSKEKQIFLDIACLLKNEKEIYVKMLFKGCEYAFTILEKKSLITVRSGILEMHDLMRQLGRENVLEESQVARHRSRLWNYKEVVHVLTNDLEAADNIQGMMVWGGLLLDRSKERCVNWSGTAFHKMSNLRILKVYEKLSEPPTYLPNNLCWIEWDYYPSATLPLHFSPDRLVVLELRESNISDCILEPLMGTYLCRLKLAGCSLLNVIPDMSRCINLRELILPRCYNLTKVHDSVGSCSKLIRLDLYGCHKLECFPRKIKMPSLEYIDLSCCVSLQHFPDIEGQINTLESIKWVGVHKMKKLPESINNVTGLKVLFIRFCEELEEMPMLKLRSLEELTIELCRRVSFRKSEAMRENDSEAVSCPNLRQLSITDSDLSDDSLATILSWYQNLECLTLSGNSFTSIPECIEELVDLRLLDVSSCHQLQNIPALPSKLSSIQANGCGPLTSDSTTMLLSQACKDIDDLQISFDLPKSKMFIPNQFRLLSNCAGIVSFQIGQIFPFAAFVFIQKRMLFDFEPCMQLFINGLPVKEAQLKLTKGPVSIVNLRINCEERKKLDAFLVNDWNNVDIQVDDCYGKCDEYLEVYGVLCNEEQMARCPLIWQNIWNWPGPERIRDFLWLMVQEKLFTNSQRLSQQLTNSDNCPRCGSSGETVMHAIRDCEHIANLWEKLIKSCHRNRFFSASACMQDWVLMNFSTKLGIDDGSDWKVTFGFACWNIWENRNDWAFDNADGAIDHRDKARESIVAISKAIESQSHARLEGLKSWELPPNDWVKFNVMNFLREDFNCGCAIQDATGSWIFEDVIVVDDDILEYMGKDSCLFIGLLIARKKGFNKIIIEVHDIWDDRLWGVYECCENSRFQSIMSQNCGQVYVIDRKSDDIPRKMADLVHNSEQHSIDFATIREWLELDNVEGQSNSYDASGQLQIPQTP